MRVRIGLNWLRRVICRDVVNIAIYSLYIKYLLNT